MQVCLARVKIGCVPKKEAHACLVCGGLTVLERNHQVPTGIRHARLVCGFSTDIPAYLDGLIKHLLRLQFLCLVSEREERPAALPKRACFLPQDVGIIVVGERPLVVGSSGPECCCYSWR